MTATPREETGPALHLSDIVSVTGEMTSAFLAIPDEGLNRRVKALLWEILAEELPLGNWHIAIFDDSIYLRTLREVFLEEPEGGEDLFSVLATFVTCSTMQRVAERRFDIFGSRKRVITPELAEQIRNHIFSIIEYIDMATRGLLIEAIPWKNCRVELLEGPQDSGLDLHTAGGRFFVGFKSGTLWINHGTVKLGSREISTTSLVKAGWKGNLRTEVCDGLAVTMEEMLKGLACWSGSYREPLESLAFSFFDLDITPRSIKGTREDYHWELKLLEQFDEENPDVKGRRFLKFVDNQGREAFDEAAFKHLMAVLARFGQERKKIG